MIRVAFSFLIALSCLSISSTVFSQGRVSISEIYYDSYHNESFALPYHHRGEFIELYNSSDRPIDISGWKLKEQHPDQTYYKFPEGSLIRAKGFVIVAYGYESDPDAYQLETLISETEGYERYIFRMPARAGSILLRNQGDALELYDDTGTLKDYVGFGRTTFRSKYWDDYARNGLSSPKESIQRTSHFDLNGDVHASTGPDKFVGERQVTPFGLPNGYVMSPDDCKATSQPTGSVVITEVYYDSYIYEEMADRFQPHHRGEFVELFNTTDETIDLSGWRLQDQNPNTYFKFPCGAYIGAGEYVIFTYGSENDASAYKIENLFDLPSDVSKIYRASGPGTMVLNNKREYVALQDPNGTLKDYVAYKSSFNGEYWSKVAWNGISNDRTQRSIQRINVDNIEAGMSLSEFTRPSAYRTYPATPLKSEKVAPQIVASNVTFCEGPGNFYLSADYAGPGEYKPTKYEWYLNSNMSSLWRTGRVISVNKSMVSSDSRTFWVKGTNQFGLTSVSTVRAIKNRTPGALDDQEFLICSSDSDKRIVPDGYELSTDRMNAYLDGALVVDNQRAIDMSSYAPGVYQFEVYTSSYDGCVSAESFTLDVELAGVCDDELHWVKSKTFGIDNNGNEIVLSEAKGYFDKFGKLLQSQGKSFANDQVFASQPVYDHNGRAALSTLSAPINSSEFAYKSNFITNQSGNPYSADDFDDPNTLNGPRQVGSDTRGTLGWYYSQNNDLEPLTPITNYPYSRSWTEESPDPTISKSAGPGNTYRMGAGREMTSEKEVIAISEVSHYYSLRHHFTSTAQPLNEDLGFKYTTTDPNGTRSYSFTDANGKTIITALDGTGGLEYQSYTYYNDLGQLVATVAPEGINTGSAAYPEFVTTYEYDHRGLLIATESTDEGRTAYMYSHDGMIRFSQDAVQRAEGWFSYTDYDKLGRLVESGQYVGFWDDLNSLEFGADLETYVDQIGHNNWDDNYKTDVIKIWYDMPADDFPSDANHPRQSFLTGQVSKTSNENTTTWYSYDEFGQVDWVVQEIDGLGIKTIDYTYDFQGNVLEVAYQKGQSDAFYHHYEYDEDQRLVNVYTSSNGTSNALHAHYEYYLHGPLKRIELGDNIQGLDFVYTINGALKSINDADVTQDPGGDTNDVFGLTMHYYGNDYINADGQSDFHRFAGYQEQYNGLVQGISWHSPTDGNQLRSYAYDYDNKNRLSSASWGNITQSGPLGMKEFNPDGNQSHSVNISDYDKHGNIDALTRKGADGNNLANYTYNYLNGTNKLSSVDDNGSALVSYDYNETGQVIRQTESGNTMQFAYDAYGNVTDIRDGNGDLKVTFDYDDKGYRIKKVAYDSYIEHTTWYVRDISGNVMSIYEKTVDETPTQFNNSPAQTELPIYGGGRIGVYKPEEAFVYYEIGDHQGNVRAVMGEPMTLTYTATMESENSSQENELFTNIDDHRVTFDKPNYTSGGNEVVRLNRNSPAGPGLALPVSAGDRVSMHTQAYYEGGETYEGNVGIEAIVTAVAGAFGGVNGGTEGQQATYDAFDNAISGAGMIGTDDNTVPAAFINYVLFNHNMEAYQQGYAPVTKAAEYDHEKIGLDNIEVPKSGFIYIYLRYESASQNWMYFDDLTVTHNGSPVVFGRDYYPFGLPMEGREITLDEYRYDYQGQFAEKDEETGLNSFELRQYDARFGRWLQIDPYGQFASPYVGMGNVPHLGVDPDGGYCCGALMQGLAKVGQEFAKTIVLDGVTITGRAYASTLENMTLGAGISLSRTVAIEGVEHSYTPGDGSFVPSEVPDYGIPEKLNRKGYTGDSYSFSNPNLNTVTMAGLGEVGSKVWNFFSNFNNGVAFVAGATLTQWGRSTFRNYGPGSTSWATNHGGLGVDWKYQWSWLKGSKFGWMKGSTVLKGANLLKWTGVGAGIIGGGMTIVEMINGDSEFIGWGGVDLAMGAVGFVPGGGWVVSSAYFLVIKPGIKTLTKKLHDHPLQGGNMVPYQLIPHD